MRLLNPGSPTDRRRAAAPTYLTAEIAASPCPRSVRLHTLARRVRTQRRIRTRVQVQSPQAGQCSQVG